MRYLITWGAGFIASHLAEERLRRENQVLVIDDEEVAILELAQRVKDIARSDSPIHKVPYDQAYEAGFEDMHRRIPSLERIRKLIGYQPTKTLDQMLEAIIKERETWIRPAAVRTPASTQQSEVQPAS